MTLAEPKAYRREFGASVPCAGEVAEARAGVLSGLSAPLRLLVPDDASRRSIRGVSCRSWQGALPRRAFVRVRGLDVVCAGGLYVSVPEFAFAHAVRGAGLLDLVLVGCEACGRYALMPDGTRGFADRPPLTSRARLASALSSLGPFLGRRRALRACSLVFDHAASPMESALALLLSLPPSLGGYGLPRPELNRRVDVPGASAGLFRDHYVCDLYWHEARLAVEYDSDAYHTGPERIARDARRRGELLRCGVTVVAATRAQVFVRRETDRLARLVARELGHRMRLGRVTGWEARNGALRDLLLPRRRAAGGGGGCGTAGSHGTVGQPGKWRQPGT